MAWYKLTYTVGTLHKALLHGKTFEEAMTNFVKGDLIKDVKVSDVPKQLEKIAEIHPDDYPEHGIPSVETEGG